MVWDTDDDIRNAPMSKELKQTIGGRRKVKKFHELSLEVARYVDLVTTTNESLADVFRAGGVQRIAVVPNYLDRGEVPSYRKKHVGTLIGMVAGKEHEPDVKGLRIAKVLQEIQRAHEHVHVVAIGVDLELRERYRYIPKVPFNELMRWVREFDIGLAPLVDSPFSRARSNVKLKEYASAGVPWLASPVGPYVGMGEAEGGHLVAPGAWEAAIATLVRSPERRAALGKLARAWARTQTISQAGGTWERAFRRAVSHANNRES
jgi:glycosyltransferase involved in cell wall biosynthesis